MRHCSWCHPHSGLPLQDTVLGACPPEAPQPMSVPRPRESGAEELERQLQALQAELREAVEARRAALEARVRVPSCWLACRDDSGAHMGSSKCGRSPMEKGCMGKAPPLQPLKTPYPCWLLLMWPVPLAGGQVSTWAPGFLLGST